MISCKSAEIFTLVETDVVLPVSTKYDQVINYFDPNNPNVIWSSSETKTQSGGRPTFPSGIQFGFNFELSPHLTIGPMLGFQKFNFRDLSIIKLDMMSRFHFIDKESIFIFVQGGLDIPLYRDQFYVGNNIRFGVGYPVWKKDWVDLNLSLFYDRHAINVKSNFPHADLSPERYLLKSIGMGFGIQLLGKSPKKRLHYKYLPENRKL